MQSRNDTVLNSRIVPDPNAIMKSDDATVKCIWRPTVSSGQKLLQQGGREGIRQISSGYILEPMWRRGRNCIQYCRWVRMSRESISCLVRGARTVNNSVLEPNQFGIKLLLPLGMEALI
jgi:hypothetical protein